MANLVVAAVPAELQFFDAWHPLYRLLPPGCRAAIRACLLMDQVHRATTTGIFRALAAVMRRNPAFKVVGDAGIEAAIGTFQNIDDP